MSIRTDTRRRIVAGLGALTMTVATVFATSPDNAGPTDAAWTDTEYARGQVNAYWPLTYVNLVAGSAKSSDQVGKGSPYLKSFEFRESLTPTTSRPDPQYLGFWLGTGVAVNDTSPNPLSKDPYSAPLHNWAGVPEREGTTRVDPQNYRCLSIVPNFARATPTDTACGMQVGDYSAGTNNTRAFGFSVDPGTAFKAFLNSVDVRTGVRCARDYAVAADPTGFVDIGTEAGAFNPYLNYGANWMNIWGSSGGTTTGVPNRTISEPLQIDTNNIGSTHYVKAMPIITRTATSNPPHAVSEVAIYTEHYIGSTLKTKMYFVISRSECGVSNFAYPQAPTPSPVFPANIPGGWGLNAYTGGTSTPAALMLRQASPSPTTSTSATSTSPATTTTSPTETSTEATVTTSAPPPDSTTSDVTTSDVTTSPTTTTSAVPTDPGTLSGSEQIVLVGNVTIDDSFVDAWVKGNTEPFDADAGVSAIDAEINNQGSTDPNWKVHTSSDPSADGWRYAAISQVTGTIVYVK